VVSETLDLFDQAIRIVLLDGHHDPGMQSVPSLLQ